MEQLFGNSSRLLQFGIKGNNSCFVMSAVELKDSSTTILFKLSDCLSLLVFLLNCKDVLFSLVSSLVCKCGKSAFSRKEIKYYFI